MYVCVCVHTCAFGRVKASVRVKGGVSTELFFWSGEEVRVKTEKCENDRRSLKAPLVRRKMKMEGPRQKIYLNI